MPDLNPLPKLVQSDDRPTRKLDCHGDTYEPCLVPILDRRACFDVGDMDTYLIPTIFPKLLPKDDRHPRNSHATERWYVPCLVPILEAPRDLRPTGFPDAMKCQYPCPMSILCGEHVASLAEMRKYLPRTVSPELVHRDDRQMQRLEGMETQVAVSGIDIGMASVFRSRMLACIPASSRLSRALSKRSWTKAKAGTPRRDRHEPCPVLNVSRRS